MVQEVQWESIQSLEELLWIWQENQKGKFSRNGKANADIAIGLLHAGSHIPLSGLEQELERVRFYLDVAWWEEHPRHTPQRIVGNKAYQVLVHILFWKLAERMKERWASDLQPMKEAGVWSEIIDFFAKSKRSFHLDGEPYCTNARRFLTSLHSSLKGKTDEPFSFHPKTKEILLQRKEGLARALVNVGAFDYILREEIFEAIPALKEKIFDDAHELRRRFPQSREWWMDALEIPRSQGCVEALRDKRTQEVARVLMELLIKRDVLSIKI